MLGWFSRWFRRASNDSNVSEVPNASSAEDRLVHRCRGDRELANRLVHRELAQRPGLSRARAAEVALDRWNHER